MKHRWSAFALTIGKQRKMRAAITAGYPRQSNMTNALSLRELRDSATRQIIVDALQSHPSIRSAAQSLQITDATLIHHMRRLGVVVRTSRSLSISV